MEYRISLTVLYVVFTGVPNSIYLDLLLSLLNETLYLRFRSVRIYQIQPRIHPNKLSVSPF